MSEPLITTLSVSFDGETVDEWNNGEGLVLERHIGFTGLKRGIAFRQYPQCPAKLVCTYGTISDLPEYRVSDETELVVFSGSATASLKRPQAESVVVESISGTAFDETGKLIYPIVNYDTVKQQLVSDKPFYGAVRVSYQAPYLLYFYEFTTRIDLNYQSTTMYGDDEIHAFYKKNHASLKMDMSFKLKEQWMPFYTVYTKIVLDELGTWEYPMNWETADFNNRKKSPDDPTKTKRDIGTFGTWSSYELNPDMSFTDERVHQIGEFDFIGRVRTSTPNDILTVQWPYFSSGLSFHDLGARDLIRFHLKFAPKPTWKQSMSYPEQNLFDAYYSINKNDIFEELQDDYPNIMKEGE